MNNSDGYVVIETKIDSKGIDKGIDNINTKMEKLRKKAEEPIEIDGVEITGTWNLSEEEQRYYERLEATLQKLELQKTKMLMTDKNIVEETNNQTQEIEQQHSAMQSNASLIAGLTYELEEMVKLYNSMQKQDIISSSDVKDAEELKSEIKSVVRQLEKLTGTKYSIKGITDIKQDLPQIDKGLEKVVKKVGKWALAIFGIRSILNLIRGSMNILGQYDEQLAVNVEYIRYLLATTLKPLIESIVNLAYNLLTYINYIAQAWFGVNLFANASLKAFEKQHKSMKDTNKQAKELQKTLAGFDEMNVLQEPKDTKEGISLPSFPKMEDVEIPDWVKWIADNGELIADIIAGIGVALVSVKLGLKGIQALGIGIAVTGVAMAISDILKFIQDPSWEGFIDILTDIAIAIGGIMLATGNWWGLLVVVVAGIVKLVVNNWGTIKKVLGQVGKWINDNIIKPVAKVFNSLWDGYKTSCKSI